tara:strand:+ start:1580 stop:1807 length:228 start_codon:yes stop_codon:yes gene_type:complete
MGARWWRRTQVHNLVHPILVARPTDSNVVSMRPEKLNAIAMRAISSRGVSVCPMVAKTPVRRAVVPMRMGVWPAR